MNSNQRDAQAPSYHDCLLPSVARTSSITQVTPAKKITFFKRGDPWFSGVRLAVHQRTFKSFSALLDELSQRVPLSFGVRSVTTPRGLHSLSHLDQLEDGGCYLCSDKKHPQAPSESGRQQGRGLSTQPSGDLENRCDALGTSSSWKGPKGPRRITLVKNTDPRFQRTVILSHRHTRSLAAFLHKASDLLHFPVKQVFTISGKKVDSLQGLLCSPLVLVCAGHESFRPPAMKDYRRNQCETSSELTSRNKNAGSWGLKAKQSIMHSRSKSGDRSRRFSLMSQRSGLSDSSMSPHHTWMNSVLHRNPQDTPVHLGPLVTDDDFEKKVHMNEDGSLSVEIKLHFHVLSEDTLLWSKRVISASTLTTASGGCPSPREVDPLHCVCENIPGCFSEPGTLGLRPCESGGEEGSKQDQQVRPGCEICANPLYRCQGEETNSWRRAPPTQHWYSRASWNEKVSSKNRTSKASISSASNDRPRAGSESNSSCCPRTLESSMGSCSGHQVPRTASERRAEQEAGSSSRTGGDPNLVPNPCLKGSGEGTREKQAPEEGTETEPSVDCQKPKPHGLKGALPGSSVGARFLKKSSERGEPCWGYTSSRETMTSRKEHTQEGSSNCSALSSSSLRNGDIQVEGSGQDTGSHKARGGSVMRLPMSLGHSGSWDAEGNSPSLFSCASAQKRRKQKSQVSATSLPSTSGLGSAAQRKCHRQHHYQRDIHSPLDSKQALSPANRGRACSDHPVPSFPENTFSVKKQTSKDPGFPSSGSLHSQYPPVVSSATITPVSHSDPQKTGCAAHFYHPHLTSAETEGNPELGVSSPAPTVSNISDSFSSQDSVDHVGKEAGNNIPKLSLPMFCPVKWPDGVKSGDHQGSCCSQIDISLVCRTHSSKMQAQQASQSQGSPQLISGPCLVCSKHCPTLPRGQLCVKKHSSSSSSNNNINQGVACGPGKGEQREETFSGLRTLPLGSKSGAKGKRVREIRGMSQEKTSGEGESLEEQEEDGGMMPNALPHMSPEAVICEWLSHIPEEPILMKYEMMNDSPNVAGSGPEGTQEDLVDNHSLESLREPAQAIEPTLEGDISEKPELDGALVTDDASLKLEEAFSQKGASGGVSGAGKEVRASNRTTVGHSVSKGVLLSRIPAYRQIRKAVISPTQGWPSSLPEVSDVIGRRLSHSAPVLITCLTRLHFFSEDLGSSVSKVRFTDSPRFQELLATYQSLWPQCGGSLQALPVTEDFTPTSSSGVDVGSGSGVCGEGSRTCLVDSTMTPERVELPLKMVTNIISCQRPSSNMSELRNQPEDLKNQPLNSPQASSNFRAWPCTTSQDEAEDSKEQMLNNCLEQLVENIMQEEGVPAEKTQEIEKEEMQEESSKEEEFPEEERVNEQELSVGGTQDGEEIQDKGIQKEEAGRDPVSVDLCPPRMVNKPTESSSSPRESDSSADKHQSGPVLESGLKQLPRNSEMVSEQTQVGSMQGTGEKTRSMDLDPDPIGVFKLLKKMEKAFMTHFASATAAIRTRWGLQNNDLLDKMVAELEQDLAWQLQDSITKEMEKIQNRPGKKVPRPPCEALRWETSLQTQQRRHRLQGLRNLSAFRESTGACGLVSLTLEDKPSLNGTPGIQLGENAEGEEFCPCETCVRKKMNPTPLSDTRGTCSTPIKKAFDLQQILQTRKEGRTNEEAAYGAPDKWGMGLLQEDSWRTGTVQERYEGLEPELVPGSGADEGGDDEGTQKLSRVEDPKLGETEGASYQGRDEDPTAQRTDRKTDTSADSDLEEEEWSMHCVNEKEESRKQGSGNEVHSKDLASGKSDLGPEGEDDSAEATKVQDTEEEGQTGKKEDSLPLRKGESQLSEASENKSPDQEGRSTPPSTTGGDTSHQRSAPQTDISSSSIVSLGNCSQVSQKGSEEEHSTGDTGNIVDEPKGVTHPERKVTGMDSESSTSEQEGAPLGPSTPGQVADGNLGLEDRKIVRSLTFTKVVDRTDEFD